MENSYDGNVLRKRLERLRPAASERLLAREAKMSPNTVTAILENSPNVRESSLLRAIRALERLEKRFAPRIGAGVAS